MPATQTSKLASKSSPKKSLKSSKEIAQVGRFGIVGIINTLIDFGLLNLLHIVFGLTKIYANVASTTVAMIFSFFANKTFVFKSKNTTDAIIQAVKFFAFTAFGLWVIQSGVFKLFDEIWPAPVNIALQICHWLGISNFFNDDFLTTNGIKLVATVASLSWNYLTYKRFVFKKGSN